MATQQCRDRAPQAVGVHAAGRAVAVGRRPSARSLVRCAAEGRWDTDQGLQLVEKSLGPLDLLGEHPYPCALAADLASARNELGVLLHGQGDRLATAESDVARFGTLSGHSAPPLVASTGVPETREDPRTVPKGPLVS